MPQLDGEKIEESNHNKNSSVDKTMVSPERISEIEGIIDSFPSSSFEKEDLYTRFEEEIAELETKQRSFLLVDPTDKNVDNKERIEGSQREERVERLQCDMGSTFETSVESEEWKHLSLDSFEKSYDLGIPDGSREENSDSKLFTAEGLVQKMKPGGKQGSRKEVERLKSTVLKDLGFSKKGSWEELDFYTLIDPFAYVVIIQDTKTLDKLYVLVEVRLSEEELHILEFIKETLGVFTFNTSELELKGEKDCLIDRVDEILEDYMIEVDDESKRKIIYFLEKQFLGLNKLEPLMRDPNIEDISCDGSDVPLFLYHRVYGSIKSNIWFDSEEELSAFVFKLAQRCGKHISISEPMLDATMPDGSRIQMTLSTEVTSKGSTFTIRKFREFPFSPPDLIEFKTMSSEIVAYMWLAVENRINALIAGGTAAGKTSTLNAIALFIPPDSKIVSIEETREINLPHPNWIPGVSRSGFGEVVGDRVIGEIDMYDLMKAALRQRPEYILVGEIRGREAYVLFQAMATGHTTYCTIHADSAQSLIHRLEGKPINIPRIMLQSLDIICIQVISRVKNKRLRKCKQIIEIIDIDPSTKEILTNEVFRWDPVEDKFIYSGKSYVLERIRAKKGLSREEIIEEIRRRAELLEWMSRKNIRDFKRVSAIFAQYTEDPFGTLKKVRDESI
jgi:flagellar protein FlaI